MKEKARIAGQDLITKIIQKLYQEGKTKYSLSKALEIYTPMLNNVIEKDSSSPSIIAIAEKFGYKPIVVYVNEENEELFRKLQDINKKAEEKLYERIKESVEQLTNKPRKSKKNKSVNDIDENNEVDLENIDNESNEIKLSANSIEEKIDELDLFK